MSTLGTLREDCTWPRDEWYPKAFKQMAVARLNQCQTIVALSQELGVSRRLLYTWREKLEPVERSEGPPANSREATLRTDYLLCDLLGSLLHVSGPDPGDGRRLPYRRRPEPLWNSRPMDTLTFTW
jgi:hypothetical protein